MAFIPEADIEKVRQAADIVRVIGDKIPLKRGGRSFKGLCPFHQEKTPSFMVNPERQIYHCFGCGEGGNVFSFLMRIDGLEFPEAVRKLAGGLGITLTVQEDDGGKRAKAESDRDLLFRINRVAARHFYETLIDPELGKKGLAYLAGRKIRPEMTQEHLLGYASASGNSLVNDLKSKGAPLEKAETLGLIRRRSNDNQARSAVEGEARSGFAGRGGDASPYYDFFRDRLIFSIQNVEGKIIGFSGRSLEKDAGPKYLNSPESVIYSKGSSILGLAQAKEDVRKSDQVIVVEGNFDQLRLAQEGLGHTVAPLGTALTERQVRLLMRFTRNFVFIFDGDEAGQKASMRALEISLLEGLSPRVIPLEPGEDPDSFVLTHGIDLLRRRLESAPLLADHILDQIFKRQGSSNAGLTRAVERGGEILSWMTGEVEKTLYIQKIAQLSGLPDSVVAREGLKRGKKGSNFLPPAGEENERMPAVERTLVEILISNRVPPVELLKGIGGEDFSHLWLGRIWEALKADFERHGTIEASRLLQGDEDRVFQRLVTELAVGSERWMETEEKVARECVARFRVGRVKDLLRRISTEIRQAETENDEGKVQELLKRKSGVLKDLTTVH